MCRQTGQSTADDSVVWRLMTDAPIGIFDSGVGGLTVARAINDVLPEERLLYLADTARVPYGPRPIAQVREYTLAACDRLVEEGIKLLVIACNSASAASLADIRERFDIPVVEVIRPAARRAATLTRSGRIGVIGTTATITSGAYADAFHVTPTVTVTSVTCPAFVDFVERGVTTGRQLLGLAQGYLEPLQRSQVDTLVLGCTHYPLLAGLIGLVMGEEVTLVSSAETTAAAVYRILTDRAALRADTTPVAHRYLVTGDASDFTRTAQRFLGPQPARLRAEAVRLGRHGLVEVVT